MIEPLVAALCLYLMLHDITACDEISHTFSHCIWRCTVATWLLKVCIQVQTGRFSLSGKYKDSPPPPCTLPRIFLMWENLPGHAQSDQRWWKMKASIMACIPFFQMKLCTQNCLILADMNLHNFLLSHQIAVLFYLTLGNTHKQLDKKIVPSSQSCLILKMWLKRDWMMNQLQNHFMEKLLLRFPQPRTFSEFQSQTKMLFICQSWYTALVMSPIP